MSLISRRTLLENAAKGGLVLSAGSLLAACGSSASSSSSATSGTKAASTGTPRHGGTLHVGLTGGSSSDTLDPNSLLNNADYARASKLYESLVWTNAQGQAYLRLADEMTPNKDATVWTIRLRSASSSTTVRA